MTSDASFSSVQAMQCSKSLFRLRFWLVECDDDATTGGIRGSGVGSKISIGVGARVGRLVGTLVDIDDDVVANSKVGTRLDDGVCATGLSRMFAATRA